MNEIKISETVLAANGDETVRLILRCDEIDGRSWVVTSGGVERIYRSPSTAQRAFRSALDGRVGNHALNQAITSAAARARESADAKVRVYTPDEVAAFDRARRSSSPPAPVVAVGIDPAQSTGLAVWRLVGGLASSACINIARAGYTEAGAIDALDAHLGPHAWVAAVEKPTQDGAGRRGGRRVGRAPDHAATFWVRVLDLVARRRATRAGAPYRKPQILRPTATQWRSALGIRTRGTAGTYDLRRAELKHAAMAYLAAAERLTIRQPDEAEAACIALWLSRMARAGTLVRGHQPQPLRPVP